MTQRKKTMKRPIAAPRYAILVIAALFSGVSAASIGSCAGRNDVASEREERADQVRDSVVVAAAWPWSGRYYGLYWQGMKMARDEVNERGGVLGRKIVFIREDDMESVNEGRRIAQRLADDPAVVAVIGHLNSHVSIPAAAIYDAAGLLMLTPGSTSPELTENGYALVFRTVNSDKDIARQMAEFAAGRAYDRIVICYVRNAYGFGLANAFEHHAQQLGLSVVDRQFYDPSASSSPLGYQRLVDQWKDIEFDALFLAGMAPQAGFLVKQVRAAGISRPILGGDALDTPELVEAAGSAADGLIVASVFHPDDPRPEAQLFNHRFRTLFGRSPDSWAARGYEAVRLLAEAMDGAGSVAPRDVARRLRQSSHFSLGGPVTFNEKGDIVGKTIVKTIVSSGSFVYLDEPALTKVVDAPAIQRVRTQLP